MDKLDTHLPNIPETDMEGLERNREKLFSMQPGDWFRFASFWARVIRTLCPIDVSFGDRYRSPIVRCHVWESNGNYLGEIEWYIIENNMFKVDDPEDQAMLALRFIG